jgi:YVTN family beta-propeller protein
VGQFPREALRSRQTGIACLPPDAGRPERREPALPGDTWFAVRHAGRGARAIPSIPSLRSNVAAAPTLRQGTFVIVNRDVKAGRSRRAAWAASFVLPLMVSACASGPAREGSVPSLGVTPPAVSPEAVASAQPRPASGTPGSEQGLPGMPPVLNRTDVYAADREGLAPWLRKVKTMVYVPNGRDGTVTVIDPATYRVVRTVPAGRVPQHVVPAYDLRSLWVNSSESNTLTQIDPVSGRPVRTVAVDDPYNLYYSPDGRFAIVVAERQRRLDFRDPQTMALRYRLPVPCSGLNHLDFSANGRYFLVSCEFSRQVVKIDTAARRIVGSLLLPAGSKPQDVKLSPDGRTFYVADLNRGGVYALDGRGLKITGFVRTGAGTHGLYVSRNSRFLYATNRTAGTVSVIDFATREVRSTWRLPAGSSPDMGNLTPDGNTLWVSSRYGDWVDAIDVRSGKPVARVGVGRGPHGLTVFPQPGRYSLGHTGILR